MIQPVGRGRTAIAAPNGRGLYYGASTLRQLLNVSRSAERILVPLVHVRDWPDLSERGLWNFPDEQNWILDGDMKLNFGKMVATQLAPIQRGQPNSATIDRDLMLESRRRAFNYSPFILHLNFNGYGLYQAYPEPAGRGDSALTGRYFAHKEGNQHRAPALRSRCSSTFSASGWNPLPLKTDSTSAAGSANDRASAPASVHGRRPLVLEARAFVRAWERACQTYPNLEIRIFLSTTTLERDWRVLAELPRSENRASFAMGLERVTHAPRDRLPTRFTIATRAGALDCQLRRARGYGDVDTPEFASQHAAHRVHNYVEQMHERGYQGAYGMIAWAHFACETDGFNIAALAEWSWN